MSSRPPGFTPPRLYTPPPAGQADRQAEIVRYIEEPQALITGNRVKLLRNGAEAFPVWLDAIDTARERISLEMYIFNDDAIGRRFNDALCRAAQRGVRVRLLYDFFGCRFAPPEFFARMRRAGIHTIVYHSHRFWRPRFWVLFRRNHRKTLVCDGQVAFTGGLNISDAWAPVSEGGAGWHDAVIQVHGRAVPAIEAAFLQTWNRRAKRKFRLEPDTLPTPTAAGDSRLAVVSNTELLRRFDIRRAALHTNRESRQRLLLANPYFVPDPGVLRALCQAAARGVSVRLLVPARSDTLLLDYAARATFPQLLRAGVRIFQHKTMVHAKALVADDDFVSLGSYNLDHRSLAYNLEMVVNTLDRRFNSDTARMLEDDMAESEELHFATFKKRTLLTKILQRLAYSCRHWL